MQVEDWKDKVETAWRAIITLIPSTKSDESKRSGKEPLQFTYGELFQDFGLDIIPKLQIGINDIFVDLGCGSGKIVGLVALLTPVRYSIGIEIAEYRLEYFKKILIESHGYQAIYDKCIPIHADIRNLTSGAEAAMRVATILYVNNFKFGDQNEKVVSLIMKYKNIKTVISTLKFCTRHNKRCQSICLDFGKADHEIKVSCSWGSCIVYIYTRKR